jgi:hypothetical protein
MLGISQLKSAYRAVLRSGGRLSRLEERFDELKINQGVILAELKACKDSRKLRDYEYRVFSQWGEDGIIQHLINVIDIDQKTFIEFGVEDFSEANCRFLLMKDNWSGFVIDGSADNIRKLKGSYYFWKYQLGAIDAFITKENINDLLAMSGFGEDLGILSLDLDGNDFHILEAITFFKPRILICEHNAVFGPSRRITVPYDPSFVRSQKHYSNLYFGASLGAITHAATKRGYSLVGTTSVGVNAFYVRNDLLNNKIEVLDVGEAYTSSKFRESRDPAGHLTYLTGDERIALIKGLPVLNVETNQIESL